MTVATTSEPGPQRDALAKGEPKALDQLFPVLYDELRRLAGRYLRRERRGHTLQPTALVNEAYLKLAGNGKLRWKDRAHFLAIAARAMRQVLVHHAKRRRRLKRGGSRRRVPLEGLIVSFEERAYDLVALDDSLARLATIDEQKSRIVELRFFGGLSIEETAEILGISHSTVERDWKFAKAWLHRELRRADGGGR